VPRADTEQVPGYSNKTRLLYPAVMACPIEARYSPGAEDNRLLRLAGVLLLTALLTGGCSSLPPPVSRPPKLCAAPGGGYVSCDPGYHGSGGP